MKIFGRTVAEIVFAQKTRRKQEEQRKRKNLENLIRPNVTGHTPDLVELGVKQAMEEFDRYMDGRVITASEVRNFLKSKANEQREAEATGNDGGTP